ncbi:hypothetical protein Syun_002889 [Stephania yunnanensis]|uniref:Uncharacterized protein n=1 Tax=Stephania yunnanensis TaxID=152371 RepID=A0AAP0L1V4_9MAGN
MDLNKMNLSMSGNELVLLWTLMFLHELFYGRNWVLSLLHILYILNAEDFSSNNFEGEIPELIGDFKSLVVLNLSYNGLEGKIPSSLGNLRDLQLLDLSNNNLSGEIPPQLRNMYCLAKILSIERLIRVDKLQKPLKMGLKESEEWTVVSRRCRRRDRDDQSQTTGRPRWGTRMEAQPVMQCKWRDFQIEYDRFQRRV